VTNETLRCSRRPAAVATVGVWLLAGSAILTQASCSEPSVSTPASRGPQTEITIEDVRNYTAFPLYWVGEEFRGLSLTKVYQLASPSVAVPENGVVFIYGTCTPPPEADEQSCSLPLQVLVEPACDQPPGEGPFFKVRGDADARESSDALRLWTGNVSVRIGGENDELELEAAGALSSPNGLGVTTSAEPLPPPDALDC